MAKIDEQGVRPLVDWLDGKLPEIPRVEKITRSGLVYTEKVTIVTGGNKER